MAEGSKRSREAQSLPLPKQAFLGGKECDLRPIR
jgi:hypothetical protein